MIWLKNSTFGVEQQSLTHSVAPEENYRYKIQDILFSNHGAQY